MNEAINRFLDLRWTQQSFVLASGTFQGWKKQFSSMKEAAKLVNDNFRDVFLQNGALFLGPPAGPAEEPISADEITRMAASGADLPLRSPVFEEVIAVSNITLGQELGFLEFFQYGLFRNHSLSRAEGIREEAKALVLRASKLASLGLTAISDSHVKARFLRPVSSSVFEQCAESALEFNSTHFGFQADQNLWKLAFKEWNGFALGPC